VNRPASISTPVVSVIVPCYNEEQHIKAFLDSALAQEGLSGPVEVIVSDGMSTDATRQILRQIAEQDSRLVIVDNPQRTVSFGLNLALKLARGAVIARMDVHSEYAPDYLHECIAALERTGADNVGGPALTKSIDYWQRANATAYHSRFSVGGAKFHDPNYEGFVDTVTYGCWYKSRLFEIGMFDEALVRNQDDELNLRIVRQGGKIWQSPKIRSWYSPRASLVSLFRQYFQYGYWKVRVIQKHRAIASLRHVVPAGTLVFVLALSAVGIWWRPAWHVVAGGVVMYLGLSVIASVRAALRGGSWSVLPVLPLVFATYHLAYATGFLRGMVDGICGARPTASVTELSR